ncbi:MAG TPA: hypothetical protein VGW39_14870 [Chthoniobacterales bacterium]|nr:hypothetical protein [Chthoniobacterales bacterium]
MTKHKQRRERRAKYFAMLDGMLANEPAFVQRVIDTLDYQGLDYAPDGKPIRADFYRYMKDRAKTDGTATLAVLDFLERAKRRIAVKPPRSWR